MAKYRDNKDWKSRRNDILKECTKRLIKTQILFESPKEYNNEGIAYKNGNVWYKFNLFTTKNIRGKEFKTNKIYIKDKKGAIEIIYKYVIFLKAIGCEKYNAYFNVYNLIYKHFLLIDGIFDCNAKNLDLIADKVYYIYNNELEVDESLIDKREFCFKDSVSNKVKKEKRCSIRRKAEGEKTYKKFLEYYPEQDNVNILAVKVGVCARQIKNLIKRYNEERGN